MNSNFLFPLFTHTYMDIHRVYTYTMDPLSEASVDAYTLLFHHHWKEKRYVLTSHTRHVGWYISPRIRIGSIILLHGWWHALQQVCCCWVDSTSSSIIMILTMVYRCFAADAAVTCECASKLEKSRKRRKGEQNDWIEWKDLVCCTLWKGASIKYRVRCAIGYKKRKKRERKVEGEYGGIKRGEHWVILGLWTHITINVNIL